MPTGYGWRFDDLNSQHRWCSLCGWLWANWDIKSLHRCTCSPDYLKPFPDRAAVVAARTIGGDEAVHAMEVALWEELRGRPHQSRTLDPPKRLSTIVGQRADLLILDDPYSATPTSPAEAKAWFTSYLGRKR